MPLSVLREPPEFAWPLPWYRQELDADGRALPSTLVQFPGYRGSTEQVLAGFSRVESRAGQGSFDNAVRVPPLLVELLTGFAQELYDAGTPLHYYRQLLAFAQPEFPASRPFMKRAWEFVTRWESLEPLQHRPPLPEPVLKAMVCLALQWTAMGRCYFALLLLFESAWRTS